MAQPQPITRNEHVDDQLLYFTSSSLTADDRYLIFITNRTGDPNLYCHDLHTGEEWALTHNTEGSLKSYVYFDGQPYRGLGKASVALHEQSGTVYYLHGRSICAVDLSGNRRVVGQYPAGQMTAFTHVSSDGKYLCVPTVDERALDGQTPMTGKPNYSVDERVQAEHLSSYLRIYETDTGKQIAAEPVPQAWITHVQFSPTDPSLILYNHEWTATQTGVRRIWLWDGTNHKPLRSIGPGQSHDDWVCHELWQRDGQWVIYHGAYHQGPAFIGRVRPDGTDQQEIAFPAHYRGYGHFTAADQTLLVSDGYYQPDHQQRKKGLWLSLLHVDWQAGQIDWQPQCEHGSTWTSQDAHPHPIFNHAADAIYFTSDYSSHRAIYRIEVKA